MSDRTNDTGEPHPDQDAAALRAEIDRLRALVGPSEQSYTDLRQEILASRDATMGAEAAIGEYRGRVNELEVALVRAQQDQEHFHQIVYNTLRSGRHRIGRAMRSRLL